MGRIILIIALVSVLVMGLVTSAGCDSDDTNANANGETPNGEATVGGEANGDQPDSSGLGLVIDCEENTTDSAPKAGDPALDFSFQDAVGTTLALSDFRGKVVVLNFWRTTCGWCVVELPYIQQFYEQLPSDEVVLLTIAQGEEPAEVATFMQEQGVSFPVLVDREEKASSQYRTNSIPCSFFIDEDGIIQAKHVGYFHDLEEIKDTLNQLTGSDVSEPENGGTEADSSGLPLIIDCEENTTGLDPQAGDSAPVFRFQDASGQTVSLSDYRGTPVMLNFWSLGCSYCLAELSFMQELYDQRPATELVLLTIAKSEESSEVASFIQEKGFSFPVVMDSAEKASTQYGVNSTPITFFIDEDGIIQVKKTGSFDSFEEIEDILNQLGW